MIFTGNSFLVLPETPNLGFSFDNFSLNNSTGIAQIGFSGSGNNTLLFKFSSGKILAPDQKIIGTYNVSEPLGLSGFISSSTYQYFVNEDLISNRISKTNYNLQKLLINLTGTTVSSDIKLNCPNIDYGIVLPNGFTALSNLSGSVVNNSLTKFKVFSNEITYFQSVEPVLSGQISGNVTGTGILSFDLSDINNSRFDSEIEMLLVLQTSIGPIAKEFVINRTGGMGQVVKKITTNSGDVLLTGLFNGSGQAPNVFTFISSPQITTKTYYVSTTNLKGDSQPSQITIQLEPITPASGAAYRSDYVTGFNVTYSGHYEYIPTPIFTGYYYIDGLDYNISTILLSSGCSGSIPILFSGVNGGTGASGTLLTNRVLLNNVYDVGTHPYYIPYAFEMMSGGTGYVQAPVTIFRSGIYANCRDVAANYGYSLFGFTPFNGNGKLVPSASYLTGELRYVTGFVSGSPVSGSGSGFFVSGIEITNDGSGYNQTLFPKVVFKRDSRDTYTGDATGIFSLKQSGLYNFINQWSINTGLSSSALTGVGSYYGQTTIGPTNNYVTVQVNYSGNDNTEPQIAKLTVSMNGGESLVCRITGTKYYDTSTGFLKKKNSLEPTLFNAGTDLSFLLTQDELDNFYSSEGYLGNTVPLDGDLDF